MLVFHINIAVALAVTLNTYPRGTISNVRRFPTLVLFDKLSISRYKQATKN